MTSRPNLGHEYKKKLKLSGASQSFWCRNLVSFRTLLFILCPSKHQDT